VNLPSKKASFSVSVATGMGLLLIGASGASADSFTVTGSDSDGPVSIDLGGRWPSRLVATAEEDRLSIRHNSHTSFAAASDCRTIAIYEYTP
jgi:hypothetical protein